jgi:hypothetical protein
VRRVISASVLVATSSGRPGGSAARSFGDGPGPLGVWERLFGDRLGARRVDWRRRGVLLVLAVVAALWPAPTPVALRGTPPLVASGAQPTAALPVLTSLGALDGPVGAVTSLAFSPDGAFLATGGRGREVLLWAGRTGRAVRDLRRRGLPAAEDDAAVSSIAFTRTGATVAAGRISGAVTLWEATTGRELRTVRGPAVAALAFAPDGRTLVVGHADGTATFWDVSRGREVLTLRAHEGMVAALAFAPGGRALATGGWDRTVKLWDAASGRELRSFAAGYQVWCLAFSPDGRVLAAGGDRAATLWETATGGELHRLEHRSLVEAIVISPNGAVLTSAGADGAVRSWAVATGRPMGSARTQTAPALAAFALWGGVLATMDVHRPRGDGDPVGSPVRLWDVRPVRAPAAGFARPS